MGSPATGSLFAVNDTVLCATIAQTALTHRMVSDKNGVGVTEARWLLVESVIRAFIAKYPRHWMAFTRDLAENRSTYNLASDGDLRKASFRHTASFPVVYRPMTPEEVEADPWADEPYAEEAALLPALQRLLPGLTDPDRPGKPNRLYKEFLRRFPAFLPADKL